MIRFNKRGQLSIYIRQKYMQDFEVFEEIAKEKRTSPGVIIGELARMLKKERERIKNHRDLDTNQSYNL